jgi:hypothetical protein
MTRRQIANRVVLGDTTGEPFPSYLLGSRHAGLQLDGTHDREHSADTG